MKKIYFFLLTLIIATSLAAQPVVNSNNLETGSAFNLYAMSNVNIANLATAGADITWDISGATATLIGSVNFLEMSETPYAAAYPEANFAMKFTSQSDASVSYSLFNLTESVFEEVANNVGTANSVSFLNYRTSLSFPFSFNSSNTDTYQKENQEIKTIINMYDGYGTFTANASTTTEVIRMNTDDNGNTSINWWKSDPLVPLFQGSSNGFVLWELTSTSMSIPVSHSNQLIEIYPNPAADELHIINKEQLSKIEIYNSLGQLQLTTTQALIDISILKSGVYILKAWSEKSYASQKFMKY
ncbi:T9SS type A sorting domain-containing protein [Cryomorpha ignava]|uniref:T9SS type A sorting domain-containing protein n=1 Tax=Cryomorpha ignava TaxID=101383 RepID=A0A7K3WTB4_9FLAO|nr:T9SS type A sorting domain-containing protein [Cryomorpha ignava]NEN24927.1 T9SS type A sorting domain-containing protein [Cryomorpha ignava]